MPPAGPWLALARRAPPWGRAARGRGRGGASCCRRRKSPSSSCQRRRSTWRKCPWRSARETVFFFHVLVTFRQSKTWENHQPTFASSSPPAAADDGLGGRRKLPDLEKSRKKEEAELLRLEKKRLKLYCKLQQETKFHLFLFSPVLPHLLLPPAPCHQPGPFHLLVLVLVVVVLFLLFLARGGLGGREVLK